MDDLPAAEQEGEGTPRAAVAVDVGQAELPGTPGPQPWRRLRQRTAGMPPAISLTGVQQNLAYQGQLTLQDTNARDWLAVLGTDFLLTAVMFKGF